MVYCRIRSPSSNMAPIGIPAFILTILAVAVTLHNSEGTYYHGEKKFPVTFDCKANPQVVACCTTLAMNYKHFKNGAVNVGARSQKCCVDLCDKLDEFDLKINVKLNEVCKRATSFVYDGRDIAYLLTAEKKLNVYQMSVLMTGIVSGPHTTGQDRTLTNLFTQLNDYNVWAQLITSGQLNANDVYDMTWCPYMSYYNGYKNNLNTTAGSSIKNVCTFQAIKWIITSYCRAKYPSPVELNTESFLKLADAVCLFLNDKNRKLATESVITGCVKLKYTASAMSFILENLNPGFYYGLYEDRPYNWSVMKALQLSKKTCTYVAQIRRTLLTNGACILIWFQIAYYLNECNVPLTLVHSDYINATYVATNLQSLVNILEDIGKLQKDMHPVLNQIFDKRDQFIYFYIGFWNTKDPKNSVQIYSKAVEGKFEKNNFEKTKNAIYTVKMLVKTYINKCSYRRPDLTNKACLQLQENMRNADL